MSDLFWLHVADDGREERHGLEFIGRSLREVRGDYEYTWTRNINSKPGPFTPICPVRPRGASWEVFDATSDSSTMWRRSVS